MSISRGSTSSDSLTWFEAGGAFSLSAESVMWFKLEVCDGSGA